MPVPLDPQGTTIEMPPEGLAASVTMLDLLPVSMREVYGGIKAARKPSEDELAATKKCLMVYSGAYFILIAKLVKQE